VLTEIPKGEYVKENNSVMHKVNIN